MICPKCKKEVILDPCDTCYELIELSGKIMSDGIDQELADQIALGHWKIENNVQIALRLV